MKKRRKSPNLPQDEGAPPLFKGALSKMRARPHYLRARPHYSIMGALHNQQALFHLSKPSPLLPACNNSWFPPPPLYLGHGGTTHSSPKSRLKKPGLWIRVHFLRIRIRIQSLMLEANTDPDPNPDPDPIRIQSFNNQKLKKNYSWNFFFFFFLIKNCNLPIPKPP